MIERRPARLEQKVGETSSYGARELSKLIRIRKMCLKSVPKLRGLQRQFPGIDTCVLGCEREEYIGADQVAGEIIVHVSVVEEVQAFGVERVHIQRPSFVGNLHAELVLGIPLTLQRNELLWIHEIAWCIDELQQGPANRGEGRRLIELPVKCAKYPVQTWCPDGYAGARAGGVLCDIW